MNKYLLLILVTLGLSSCNVKDEHYYQKNPKELQRAVKACPGQQPKNLTCAQIEVIANRLNLLAYQLQSNPQGFGAKILSLQEKIASEQMALNTAKGDDNLKANFERNKQDLADRLAVVKWLESPEG